MRLRKKLAGLMVCVMMLSSMSIQALANEAVNGIPQNSWSTEALNAAVANGLLVGDSTGHVQPKSNITRAEAVAIINRAFGAANGAPIDSSAWYAADMGKGVHMGIIDQADLRPDDAATREEVFSMLGRAMTLSDESTASLSKFADAGQVSADKKAVLSAMVSAGYVSGSLNTEQNVWNLAPNSAITREEFAQVMYSTIRSYEGTSVTSIPRGNIMLRNANTTVDGVTVTGDLIIGDGVGDGDVTIKDTVINGRLVVRGGGRNTINVVNSQVNGVLHTAKVDGNVRIKVTGSSIASSFVQDGAALVAYNGSFGSIDVTEGVPFILEGGSADSIHASGNHASVTIGGGSKVGSVALVGNHTHLTAESGRIDKVTTSGEGTRVKVEEGAAASNITARGNNTVIYGNGTVNNVQVDASNCGIYTGQTEVAIADSARNTIVGGKNAEGGTTAHTEKPVTPPDSVIADTPDEVTPDNTQTGLIPGRPTSGGGGGGSKTETVSVTNIQVQSATQFTFIASESISSVKVEGAEIPIVTSVTSVPFAINSNNLPSRASGGNTEWTVCLDTPNALNQTPKKLEVARSGYTSYTNTTALKFTPATAVTVSPSSLTLEVGGSGANLTATVTPSSATLKTATWASSNPSVAMVGNNGSVTPIGVGTATITATTPEGLTDTCSVTVNPAPVRVTGVTLDKTTLELSTIATPTDTLTATVTPSNATNQNVTWSTSDASVATVSGGTVTAVAEGTATITAKTGDGGYTAACIVTVSDAVPVDVVFSSLAANGSSWSVSTDKLTITLDQDVPGLSADDIVLVDATKGALTSLGGGVYELAISDIEVEDGNDVQVVIAKAGYTFTPATMVVQVWLEPQTVSFTGLTANGTSGSASTTELTITLDKEVAGLVASNITVTGATKGALTNSGGGIYKLKVSDITVDDGDDINVKLSRGGYIFTPDNKDVAVSVYHYMHAWAWTSNWQNATVAGTKVEFPNAMSDGFGISSPYNTFTVQNSGLYEVSYTVRAGLGETLLFNTAFELDGTFVEESKVEPGAAINEWKKSFLVDLTAGQTFSVQLYGYVLQHQLAYLNLEVRPAEVTDVTFLDLTANGSSGTLTTDTLTITLDQDVTALSESDITVTGATKGTLTDNGGGFYALTISDITVADGGNVSVALSKTGYTFAPASRDVAVNVAPATNGLSVSSGMQIFACAVGNKKVTLPIQTKMDGFTASGPNTTFTAENAGTYTISYTVNLSGGSLANSALCVNDMPYPPLTVTGTNGLTYTATASVVLAQYDAVTLCFGGTVTTLNITDAVLTVTEETGS